ncbi:MAG: 6-bladed beta-propeller [Candidatus Krumholzibacteriia bacterium]
MTRPTLLPLALLASLVLPALAAWQGEITRTADGLRVVNPETPAAGDVVLDAHELWRVGGDDEEVLLGVVSELLTDAEGRLYVLDGQLQEIQVFDQDGAWLTTIGRAGEGPGEFRNAGDMFWSPSGQIGVIQNWPGKIVMLRTDGSPGDQFALPYGKGGSLQAASRGAGQPGRIVLSGSAWTTEGNQQMQRSYLKAYDQQGQELASFVEQSTEMAFGDFAFKETSFSDFQRRWAASRDGRVAAALTFDAYRIHVWNADGSLDRIIERPEFANVKRTASEKDMFQQIYGRITSWNPGSTFEVADVHQSIGRVFYHDDGSLWVQSSRDQWRNEEPGYAGFDVFDAEGRYVQRVRLDLGTDPVQDGVFLLGNRLYVVTDLMSAFMSLFGAAGDASQAPEPVSVICFAFQPPGQAISAAGGK